MVKVLHMYIHTVGLYMHDCMHSKLRVRCLLEMIYVGEKGIGRIVCVHTCVQSYSSTKKQVSYIKSD